MASPKVTIPVALDPKPAIAGLKDLVSKFRSSATEINQSLELLGKGYNFIAGGIGMATDAITGWTKAAMEAEAAERKAIAGLALRGGATQENVDKLKEFNNALQQKGLADADDLLGMQARLSALGIMPNKLEGATKATLGLAAATGQDLTRASRAVAKAFAKGDGSEKGLIEMFALAEAQAGSLDAKLKTFGSNLGDLEETLGSAFTSSGALKGGLEAVNEALSDLTTYFSSPEGKEAVNDFFGFIIEWGADVIDAFSQVIDGIDQLYENFRRRVADIRGDAVFITSSEENSDASLALKKLAGGLRKGARRDVEAPAPLPPGNGNGGPLKKKSDEDPALAGGPDFSSGGENFFGTKDAFAAIAETEKNQTALADLRQQEIEAREEWIEINKELGDKDFDNRVELYDKNQKLNEEQKNNALKFYAAIADNTLTGLIGVGEAILSGQGNALAALGELFAGMLDQTGDFLIAQGGASEIAASLLAFFGIPGVGAAAIATGIGLKVAAGAARALLARDLSGPEGRSGGGRGQGPRGDGRSGQPTFRRNPFDASGVGRDFTPSSGGGSIVNNTFVFPKGFVVGTERGLAREIKRIMESGSSMKLAGAR